MNEKIYELRSLMNEALEVHSKFFKFWNSVNKKKLVKDLTKDDSNMLEELILARMEVLNCFELLLQLNPLKAKKILVSRYLGDYVNPDSKFGGYQYELSIMLDDYNELLGTDALIELINHPDIKLERLKDKRVMNSFIEALDFNNENDVVEWIDNNKK